MGITTVIFDLDGTLLDTSEGVLESVRYAAARLGCGELPRETLLRFIGPPLQASFPRYYGLSEADTVEAIRLFRECYTSGAIFHARPYAGIFDLLEALGNAGLKLAVATNKAEPMARRLLGSFGFDRWCSPIRGADLEGKLGKADIIRLCLEELGEPAGAALLVGDTEHDAAGAAAAGVGFLAVTYGFGFRRAEDALPYSPVGTAASPAEVLPILRGLV